jgi:hypothetical protein
VGVKARVYVICSGMTYLLGPSAGTEITHTASISRINNTGNRENTPARVGWSRRGPRASISRWKDFSKPAVSPYALSKSTIVAPECLGQHFSGLSFKLKQTGCAGKHAANLLRVTTI